MTTGSLPSPPGKTGIRAKASLRFAISFGVFALVLVVICCASRDYQAGLHEIVLAAVPGAYAFSCLLEIVTGVPFSAFARRWDELRGWQRGVFGVFIVAVAGALIVFIAALSAAWLAR